MQTPRCWLGWRRGVVVVVVGGVALPEGGAERGWCGHNACHDISEQTQYPCPRVGRSGHGCWQRGVAGVWHAVCGRGGGYPCGAFQHRRGAGFGRYFGRGGYGRRAGGRWGGGELERPSHWQCGRGGIDQRGRCASGWRCGHVYGAARPEESTCNAAAEGRRTFCARCTARARGGAVARCTGQCRAHLQG